MNMKTVIGKFIVGLAKWFYRLRIITKEDLEYHRRYTMYLEELFIRSR